MSGRKEPLAPRVAGRVGIYWCGVTTYSRSHIGHARAMIASDVLHRYLRSRGVDVTFVRNITDIEDKIIRRAAEEGIEPSALVEREIAAFAEDAAWLGCLTPTYEPRATAHIDEMVALIERLEAKGYAYRVCDNSVYFRVRNFADYGKLSHQRLADMAAGEEVDERKRDPLDFALWKAAKPGEPSWPSPWGPGRPGWHIECSAMAMQYLGESFDLHGGGEDLIFPHHENEIAQSEGATGKPFVQCWAHNGFVNLGSEKMSKSLGNTLWIRDMVARHDPEALRLYFLGTHYRHPLEYADERIAESARALGRLRVLVEEAERVAGLGPQLPGTGDAALLDQVDAHVARFIAVMDDDFNTPQALAVLFDLLRALHAAREQGAGAGAFVAGVGKLVELARVLGLLEQAARPSAAIDPQLKARVESLIYLREQARKQRDFAEADRLRSELTALNVTLKDSRDGTTWTISS